MQKRERGRPLEPMRLNTIRAELFFTDPTPSQAAPNTRDGIATAYKSEKFDLRSFDTERTQGVTIFFRMYTTCGTLFNFHHG